MEKALQKSNPGIKGLMSNEMVKAKFSEILGKNGPAFISSVVTLATTTKLQECDPKSVLASAIAAASLNLQVTPTLGFAAIVPYGKQAQFQIMAKGLVQLALRSGQFRTINVTEIYAGEMKTENRLTGEFDFSGERTSDEVVGYAAYFELINGFSKSLYMSVSQIEAHGLKFSKTFNFPGSSWKQNFEAMARKTVLKLLLSRYAPLSVEMQSAISQDQAELQVNDSMEVIDFTYVDNPATDNEMIPVEKPVIKKKQVYHTEAEIKKDQLSGILTPSEAKRLIKELGEVDLLQDVELDEQGNEIQIPDIERE